MLHAYTLPIVTSRGRRLHPVLAETIALIARDSRDFQTLADEAGVAMQTLYNWTNGNVFLPRLDKLAAVLTVLGYQLVIIRGEYAIQ